MKAGTGSYTTYGRSICPFRWMRLRRQADCVSQKFHGSRALSIQLCRSLPNETHSFPTVSPPTTQWPLDPHHIVRSEWVIYKDTLAEGLHPGRRIPKSKYSRNKCSCHPPQAEALCRLCKPPCPLHPPSRGAFQRDMRPKGHFNRPLCSQVDWQINNISQLSVRCAPAL